MDHDLHVGSHKACTAMGLVLLGFPLCSGACGERDTTLVWCVSQLCSVSGTDDLCLAVLTGFGVLKIFTGSHSSISVSKEKAHRS